MKTVVLPVLKAGSIVIYNGQQYTIEATIFSRSGIRLKLQGLPDHVPLDQVYTATYTLNLVRRST